MYSRPNSLNTRAPEESLPRTQGVHYIFPFSPQTKRESRQIDLNDQAEIVQENNESEKTEQRVDAQVELSDMLNEGQV